MDTIKDIVHSVVGDLSRRQPQQEEKLKRFWLNVLKGKAAKHIHVYGIKDDTLKVFVDSPAWLFQLNLNKRKILQELQESCAEIKDVRFKLGKVT